MHIIQNSIRYLISFFPSLNTRVRNVDCLIASQSSLNHLKKKSPRYLNKSKKSDVYIFFQTRREIQSKTLTNTHTQGNGFFFVDSTGLCLCVNIRPAEKRRKKKSLRRPGRVTGSSFCRVRRFLFFFIFIICCRRHRSIVEIHKMCCEQQQAAHRQKKRKRNEYIGYISLGD